MLSSGGELLVTLSGHELWCVYLYCYSYLRRQGGYVGYVGERARLSYSSLGRW